ncbi:coiled-coil domain protein, partial [Trypanosoma cruzi]
MPPPKKSVALRHRAHMIASSVEDQEAALMEWRARAQQGKETLQRIRSKMDAHKKSAETTKRGGRWLAEWASLQREAVSRDLELSKAYASCAHLLPQSLRNKLTEQEEQKNELLGYLSERVTRIRKELERLHKQKNQPSQEALRTLSESISALRKELLEKKVTDVKAEKMICGEANGETDKQSPMETLQRLIQSTMKTFDGICESIDGKINAALVETYRNALQTEGENTTSQAAACIDRRVGTVLQSQNDLRTVSLILKTYDSEVESGTTAAAISDELYDRVQRALPHLSKMSARRVVDEALRQKRGRVYMRSVILQYKKRSTELLESFKKAVMAEEEIMKMRNAISEEARMREERQQKTQEELERLRIAREAKDASRRAEEEAKKMEEDEKHQKLLCSREAEFQERLRRLRE